MRADREILERAVAAMAVQAHQTDALVHEAIEVGLGGRPFAQVGILRYRCGERRDVPPGGCGDGVRRKTVAREVRRVVAEGP